MIVNAIFTFLATFANTISGLHVLLLIVITIVMIARVFIKRELRAHRLMSKIPCPPKHFIIGNTLALNKPNEEMIPLLQLWSKLYGKRFAVWLGFNTGRSRVVMSNANDVEKVLASQVHITKSVDYDFLFPWLGTGLLTSRGAKWFRRRKMLTPSFHFRILEDFLEIFNEQAKIMVRILGQEFGDGRAFNIFPFVTRCALDIICETAMGKPINAQKVRDSDYVKAVYRISELIQYRQLRPWFHPNIVWHLTPKGREERNCLTILHRFTEKVIQERKQEFVEKRRLSNSAPRPIKPDEDSFVKGKKRVAFMDSLLEAQAQAKDASELTDLDIREETDTFMFEGHDTTAANVNWTIFLLACHPEYQAKVQEELDGIFGENSGRSITSEDMSQMKYLEYCIKESLRLYPSVPCIARSIDVDLVLDDKITLPGGITAMILPYQLHRDPDVFPDPETFLPDRFFPENVVNRNPFAYVPFSAGPRNCIGQKFAMMEEKVVLSQFFRKFSAVAAEKREDLVLMAELIMRPKHGLHIKISPRF